MAGPRAVGHPIHHHTQPQELPMLRYRLLTLLILTCSFTSLAHAELKVGVGKAIITPDPLLPVSGGVGPGSPATGKQGELTARAMVFQQGETKVADRATRPARVPLRPLRPRSQAGAAHPGRQHPHRLDPHAQRPGLLRLPRPQRQNLGRSQVHGLRLQSGRHRHQSGARQPSDRSAQDRHRRSQGKNRLQLLRSGTLRPADERHPGHHARPARPSARWSTTPSIPKSSATESAWSAPTSSARSATSSKPTSAAWACS